MMPCGSTTTRTLFFPLPGECVALWASERGPHQLGSTLWHSHSSTSTCERVGNASLQSWGPRCRHSLIDRIHFCERLWPPRFQADSASMSCSWVSGCCRMLQGASGEWKFSEAAHKRRRINRHHKQWRTATCIQNISKSHVQLGTTMTDCKLTRPRECILWCSRCILSIESFSTGRIVCVCHHLTLLTWSQMVAGRDGKATHPCCASPIDVLVRRDAKGY